MSTEKEKLESASVSGRREITTLVNGEPEMGVLRREVLVAKLVLIVCEATAFPWLTEFYTRPQETDDAQIRIGTAQFFESLLPSEKNSYDVTRAKECMRTAECLIELEKYEEAIVSLRQIERLVPREYKVNQKAKLMISQCLKEMGKGNSGQFLEEKSKIWWWSRGVRWPKWYVISYLGVRYVYFESQKLNNANNKTKKNPIRTEVFSLQEGILIATLGMSYVTPLSNTGSTDL